MSSFRDHAGRAEPCKKKIVYQARSIYVVHGGAWPDNLHVAILADARNPNGVAMAAALMSMDLAIDDDRLKSTVVVTND